MHLFCMLCDRRHHFAYKARQGDISGLLHAPGAARETGRDPDGSCSAGMASGRQRGWLAAHSPHLPVTPTFYAKNKQDLQFT